MVGGVGGVAVVLVVIAAVFSGVWLQSGEGLCSLDGGAAQLTGVEAKGLERADSDLLQLHRLGDELSCD